MMNTRSQARARATASSSRAAAAAQDRMGIRFADKQHRDRFNKIKNREVKTTKWACPIILNQLGITNDFNLLCNRVGLQNFVFQNVPTYRRLTLVFLSSLKSTVHTWQGEDRISFRLLNTDYSLSLDEFCHHLQLPIEDASVYRIAHRGVGTSPDDYFRRIGRRARKGKNIQCPTI